MCNLTGERDLQYKPKHTEVWGRESGRKINRFEGASEGPRNLTNDLVQEVTVRCEGGVKHPSSPLPTQGRIYAECKITCASGWGGPGVARHMPTEDEDGENERRAMQAPPLTPSRAGFMQGVKLPAPLEGGGIVKLPQRIEDGLPSSDTRVFTHPERNPFFNCECHFEFL